MPVPEIDVCVWRLEYAATLMTMPEAAIDQNRSAMTRQGDIWTPRKVFPVQSEARRVQYLGYGDLGLGVLALYPRHHLASFFRR